MGFFRTVLYHHGGALWSVSRVVLWYWSWIGTDQRGAMLFMANWQALIERISNSVRTSSPSLRPAKITILCKNFALSIRNMDFNCLLVSGASKDLGAY